jgi:hypothetical protein
MRYSVKEALTIITANAAAIKTIGFILLKPTRLN